MGTLHNFLPRFVYLTEPVENVKYFENNFFWKQSCIENRLWQYEDNKNYIFSNLENYINRKNGRQINFIKLL